MFESDVGGMFLASLNKYLKSGICSKCTGSQLVRAAAGCLQELWKEKLSRACKKCQYLPAVLLTIFSSSYKMFPN